MNITYCPSFVIRTVNIEGGFLTIRASSASVRKTPESIEGSTGRDSTYPNVILFTATLLPFSSRISSVSTYLKALYLPLLLSHPATPFFSSVVRVSLLTTRIPSFPLPSHPLRVPSTLPPPPTWCPAHRALLTIALTLSSSLSLSLSLFHALSLSVQLTCKRERPTKRPR